jgi:hypothetical protein
VKRLRRRRRGRLRRRRRTQQAVDPTAAGSPQHQRPSAGLWRRQNTWLNYNQLFRMRTPLKKKNIKNLILFLVFLF